MASLPPAKRERRHEDRIRGDWIVNGAAKKIINQSHDLCASLAVGCMTYATILEQIEYAKP